MNKKILTAAMTLVFAAVAVAGSTYAWFTLNQTATVDTLNVNVTAGEGLYVSLTGEEGSFSSSIEPTVPENFKFIPVTTLDGATFKDRTETAITGDANGAGGYVSFDVYLRSKAELGINLSSASVESAGKSLAHLVPNKTLGGVWAPSDGKIAYATTDPSDLMATFTAKAANATRFSVLGGTSTKIFDLTDDAGFGERVMPDDTEGDPWTEEEPWTWTVNNTAFEYLQLVSPKELDGAKISEVIYTPVTSLTGSGELIGTLTNTYEYDGLDPWTDNDWYAIKLTVNIWLEGWDADCFDVLFNDTVTIDMAFTGAVAP